jgi:hypothetical protein
LQAPVTIERGRTDVLWTLLASPVTTSVAQPARSVVKSYGSVP